MGNKKKAYDWYVRRFLYTSINRSLLGYMCYHDAPIVNLSMCDYHMSVTACSGSAFCLSGSFCVLPKNDIELDVMKI